MSSRSFCTQCGAALAPGVRFCGSCGNPVVADGPAPAAASTQTPAAPTPNASEIVYLFGDSFVSKDSWRSQGVVLETSGVKVQKKPIAQAMILAAISSLVKGQWVDLQTATSGMLVFKQEVPVLRRASATPNGLRGLEGALIDRLDGAGGGTAISQVVERLVGSDQADPWENVFSLARGHLVETGHFARQANPEASGLGRLVHSQYRLEPQRSLIDQASRNVGEVKALMDSVRSSRRRAWDLASKQIDQTLKACQSKPDNDDDDSASNTSWDND